MRAGRVYEITRISSRYVQRRGRRLYHFFDGYAGRLRLTLRHDSESLGWTLEEMDDGWTVPSSPTPPDEPSPSLLLMCAVDQPAGGAPPCG
jgi:hypothetical protein